jgi:hypothetical protein
MLSSNRVSEGISIPDISNCSPKITKDGVTVAKSIVLQDKFENLGARYDPFGFTNKTCSRCSE